MFNILTLISCLNTNFFGYSLKVLLDAKSYICHDNNQYIIITSISIHRLLFKTISQRTPNDI